LINVNKNGQWSLAGTDLKKYKAETEDLQKATKHFTDSQRRDFEQKLADSAPTHGGLNPHEHIEGTVHPGDAKPRGTSYNNRPPRLAHVTKAENQDGSKMMTWQNHPLTTTKQENQISAFMDAPGAQQQLGLSDQGWAHLHTLKDHVASDPDRGAMKGGTSLKSSGMPNEIRTRHLLKILDPADNNFHVTQNDNGSINMHTGERHGERDKSTGWKFDGKTLHSTLVNAKGDQTHGSFKLADQGKTPAKPKMTKKQIREKKKAKGDKDRAASMKVEKNEKELIAEEILMKAECERDLDTLERWYN